MMVLTWPDQDLIPTERPAMPRLNRTGSVAITCACILALAGCGRGDGLGRRYRISGKVAYKGQPVKKAMILFAPVGDGLAANAAVADGAYRNLTSGTEDDGILPGKYRVNLLPYPEPDPQPVAPPTPAGEDQNTASSAPGPVYTTSGQPLPEKYLSLATSGLEVEVTPSTFAFDFDLGHKD